MSLALRGFSAANYRSIENIYYSASDLDVFVGANGVGKTNLYRALELVQAAADNRLGQALAAEGLASALWAGPRQDKKPPKIRFSVELAEREAGVRAPIYRYEVEVGFPPKVTGAFELEPQIKTEALSYVTSNRAVRLFERKGRSVMARNEAGRPAEVDIDLLDSETVLGRLEDPSRYPELDAVRRTLLAWRFYHGLRTDAGSALRRPAVAVASPTLSSDGGNLAAVFATLVHIRTDVRDLEDAIARAFPGAGLVVPKPGKTATFAMTFAEFPGRVFEAEELSDGTLRYLALMGALLAYRLPPFIALNEPESSLHPDLMDPLAELIIKAARRTQVWLVTHSERLADAIAATGAGKVRTVIKRRGATWVDGLTRAGVFGEEDEDDD